MKYLIAGLGNIGAKYENTRHNIGFNVLNRLAEVYNCQWELDRLVHKTELKYRGKKLILIKPTTYMNLSGKAVNFWMEKENIGASKLLVVHDDLHIDYKTIRIKTKGSHAGHNGLKDIDRMLGHNKYPRLRVGIGDDFHPGHQVNYVLGEWTKKEEEFLFEIENFCVETIHSFVHHGIGPTMSTFNKKLIGED